MTGVIGIDVQATRTAVTLLEPASRGIASAPVGDGRRWLIPHAAAGGLWGSVAAEHVLGDRAAAIAEAFPQVPDDLLLAWLVSPWSPEFLGGVRRRLDDYLGQTQPGPRRHQIVLATDPDSDYSPGAGRPASADPARSCAAAGLAGVTVISPADALACRWLAETAWSPEPGRPSATLLVVVCGEAATLLRRYDLARPAAGGGPATALLRPGPAGRVSGGSAGWVTGIARDVLSRCRPGVPAPALLALLDGVTELGAMTRARGAAAEVEWTGALAEHLFAPLLTSGAELARRPAAPGGCCPVRPARPSSPSAGPARSGRSPPTRWPPWAWDPSGAAASQSWTWPWARAGGRSCAGPSPPPRPAASRPSPGRTARPPWLVLPWLVLPWLVLPWLVLPWLVLP
jgi:hypothetical protein